MYIPGETSCFECATDTDKKSFEELPFVKDINSRFQVPSFSPVNGMAATVATKEALCFLAGINSWVQTTSQMFGFDTQTLESDVIDISTTKDVVNAKRRIKMSSIRHPLEDVSSISHLLKLPYFEFLSCFGLFSMHPGGLDQTINLMEDAGLNDSDRILEIGCGTGLTSQMLHESRIEVHLLEPNIRLLQSTLNLCAQSIPKSSFLSHSN